MCTPITGFIAALILLIYSISVGAHTPPNEARVFFVGLQDGAIVTSPFKVIFGIDRFGITPAGTKSKIRHTAVHHHLLVDIKQLPDLDEPIPRDGKHIHYDLGETETVLELVPGRHTLQLLLGDETHEPHDPPLLSERITVTAQ
ncbi:MAG: DUF4399 domain-containing protein [Candidatus Thiodiazotropha sp.]|nr:DUF4399 domain-containing protein [Candidatus Thiodiazotropha sp.]MCM8884968.1 DUF4399 domain-containing protein [Candidatus Thiodiazotropha sp.]MCM8922388.1 DUF4399 domain-containing protein [Candidatus Thiodiazotropha sp.]